MDYKFGNLMYNKARRFASPMTHNLPDINLYLVIYILILLISFLSIRYIFHPHGYVEGGESVSILGQGHTSMLACDIMQGKQINNFTLRCQH